MGKYAACTPNYINCYNKVVVESISVTAKDIFQQVTYVIAPSGDVCSSNGTSPVATKYTNDTHTNIVSLWVFQFWQNIVKVEEFRTRFRHFVCDSLSFSSPFVFHYSLNPLLLPSQQLTPPDCSMTVRRPIA
ncbi:hypothetical protein J6590_001623 [Homalodisca vitripennis]|nr:hypothetical protein J6590_001623 [Homalodisca vitripennis]